MTTTITLSDAETFHALEEAQQQLDLEQCLTLASLASLAVVAKERPSYSWNAPIGLVITSSTHGDVGADSAGT